MTRAYDFDSLRFGCALDLSFQEGVTTSSVYVEDASKQHHSFSQIHTPVWTRMSNGQTYLIFSTGDGLSCLASKSSDLVFGSGIVWTFAAWLYPTATSGPPRGILSKADVASGGWVVYHSPSEGVFKFYDYAPGDLSNQGWGPIASLNTWQLLLFERAGSGSNPVYWYLNGKYQARYDPAYWHSGTTADFKVGVEHHGWTFGGSMANVRCWNRWLSQYEIARMFHFERDFFGV